MRKNTIRAPRLGALLLAVLLALSLLPVGAMAAGEAYVASEKELAQAVRSGEYDVVHLSCNIELSAPLSVDGELTLDLNGHRLSAVLDPDTVSAPLATVILEKSAKLTVKGEKGSHIAPPRTARGQGRQVLRHLCERSGQPDPRRICQGQNQRRDLLSGFPAV